MFRAELLKKMYRTMFILIIVGTVVLWEGFRWLVGAIKG